MVLGIYPRRHLVLVMVTPSTSVYQGDRLGGSLFSGSEASQGRSSREESPVKRDEDNKTETSGAGKLSRRHERMIEDYWEIEQQDARSAGALGFLTRTLAQATLPHIDPKLPAGMLYSRSTGQVTLNIAPTTRRYGVPFGSIPRITLAWICTEAVRTKEPVLVLGKSQREFLGKLQMHNNGHDIARMREQCMRLFRAVISIEYEDERGEQSRRLPITNSDTVFWHRQADVQSLWTSQLELTHEFFHEVTTKPVPMDLRVYHALSKSPLAMDIYTWLTYRMFLLRVSGKPAVRVPWAGLMGQLGAGYPNTQQGLRNFRLKFRTRLKEVLLFYPEASGHVVDEGSHLKLTPAALHMPAKSAQPRLL